MYINPADKGRSMPLYYLNICEAQGVTKDLEGYELSGFDAALREASEGAREIAADAIRSGRAVGEMSIEVTDEHGVTLATVHLQDIRF
jgi:hypothetical protein